MLEASLLELGERFQVEGKQKARTTTRIYPGMQSPGICNLQNPVNPGVSSRGYYLKNPPRTYSNLNS